MRLSVSYSRHDRSVVRYAAPLPHAAGQGTFYSEQAEALAEALGEASQGDLATKADLAEVRTEIAGLRTELKTEIADVRTEIAELRTEFKAEIADVRTEIAELRTEFKAEIAAVRTELLKWIIGAIGFQTVVILGALMSIIKIFAK